MTYRTVEVELDHGRVSAQPAEALPAKARALLTILEASDPNAAAPTCSPEAGLRRFLSQPDLPLTAEQFQASMSADFWEQ